jgi:membrane protease subunit HflC
VDVGRLSGRRKERMRAGIILLICIAAVTLVCSSVFYIVNEWEYGILMEFGKPAEETLRPGLHVKWPIVNTVQRYDRRVRVHVTRDITQTLADKKIVILQAYLCWRISDPLRFYESVRYLPEAKQKLNDAASSVLGSAISNYSMTSLVSVEPGAVKLPQIEARMRDGINTVKKGAERASLHDLYGMTVERFGINRFSLPEASERAVYDRMKSEREVAASEYRTQGRKEADVIRARATQAAEATLSEARSEATRIRGEGDAKATQIYRDAYSKDPEFYRFYRTLEAYRKILGSETTLVIPADSELMRYFRMPEAREQEKGKD